MNNDIQLSTNTQTDFWTQGGAQVLAPAPAAQYGGTGYSSGGGGGGSKLSPLTKVHRLLRGRYPLVITLAAVGAVAGLVGGYTSTTPKFEAISTVNLSSTIVQPGTLNDIQVAAYQQYIGTQSALIQSPIVADTTLADPEFKAAWEAAYKGQPLPSASDVISSIDPEHPHNTDLIRIHFIDKAKGVAEAGVHAVTRAYKEKYGSGRFGSKIAFNVDEVAKADNQLAQLNRELDTLSAPYGTDDLSQILGGYTTKLGDAQTNLMTLNIQLEQAQKSATGAPKQQAPDKEWIYSQIAQRSPTMQAKLTARDVALKAFEDAKQTYGPGHTRYRRAESDVAFAQQEAEKFAEAYLAGNGGNLPWQADGSAENMDQLKFAQSRAQMAVGELQKTTNTIGAQKSRIDRVKERLPTRPPGRREPSGSLRMLRALTPSTAWSTSAITGRTPSRRPTGGSCSAASGSSSAAWSRSG